MCCGTSTGCPFGCHADHENDDDPIPLEPVRETNMEAVPAMSEQKIPAAEQHAALLNRLADLTEAAGKRRSTEWIRTCATLPMEEWPLAPAYKGPMVPAAERDQLQARIDAALAELDRPAPQVSHGGNALWDTQNHWSQQVRLICAALQGGQRTEPSPVDSGEAPAKPWFIAEHCCEAGAVAYPRPCPHHPAELSVPSGRCPNDPPCEHPATDHDFSDDPEDPAPMCCIEGCQCGQPLEFRGVWLSPDRGIVAIEAAPGEVIAVEAGAAPAVWCGTRILAAVPDNWVRLSGEIDLKDELKRIRDMIMSDSTLRNQSAEDLRAACILLIMYLNRRAADHKTV